MKRTNQMMSRREQILLTGCGQHPQPMTQVEFCARTRLSLSYANRLLRGERSPSLGTIQQISESLCLDPTMVASLFLNQ